MPDFLLELFSEEIPARMQAAASAQLAERFKALLDGAGLRADSIKTFVTPRRLALLARGLPAASEATAEERRGPRADAPEQAIAGFLKSTGLTRAQLQERDTGKGRFLFAVIASDGRLTADLLAAQLPALVDGFQWPKSMRWLDTPFRWVRPLRGIVALLDAEVVPFDVQGVASGRSTYGHRFMGSGEPIAIDSAQSWAGQLRSAHVLVDAAERRRIIREGAARAAEAAGLALVADDALEAENAGLTEWPVPLLGRFDPAFLDVPPEIIQLTMKVNQKYFAVASKDGTLAPAFICTANLEAPDGGAAIVAGNERVLSARLADARFFWEQDLKVPLEEQAKKLSGIVFHEKIGTISDKIERVDSVSYLVSAAYFPGIDFKNVKRTIQLSKSDLVTGTVGEFPELQGIIGSYLASAQGEHPIVSQGIREHYKPIGASDSVPVSPVSIIVALVDKVDTIAAFFSIGEKPTGSKDPFALRRAALGIVRIISQSGLRIHLLPLLEIAALSVLWSPSKKSGVGHPHIQALFRQISLAESLPGVATDETYEALKEQESAAEQARIEGFQNSAGTISKEILAFIIDRLKVQQREAGVRPDIIDAVFALGDEDDIVRLLARVKAVQAFLETDDGANLLAGYRRAANILRAEEKKDGREYRLDLGTVESDYIGETEKNLARLFARSDGASGVLLFDEADALFAAEEFAGVMKLLATLRAPVDGFFESVTVNDVDPQLRERRLKLLAGVREAMHKVADFSKIQGSHDA